MTNEWQPAGEPSHADVSLADRAVRTGPDGHCMAALATGFQNSEVLTDSERPAAKDGSDIRKYPRSWWKETYDAPKGNYKK